MKIFARIHLGNSRGSSLVMVTVMLAVVSVLGLGVLESQRVLHQRINSVRAKAKLLTFENRLKNLLMQTTTYQGCTYQASGNLTCSIRNNVVAPYLTMPIHGHPCRAASCSITATSPQLILNSGKPRVTYTVSLQGEGLVGSFFVEPVTTFDIPKDILQDRQVNCPVSAGPLRPVFKGFTSSGNADCQPIPRSTCNPGFFVSGLERDTSSVVCAAFPSNVLSCPSGSGLSVVNWQGGPQYQGSCYTLPSPFAVMGPN